jgi:serine/threonine-protein kinase
MVQVSHANIISVLDLIDAGDIVAIVMEYVSGKSLKEYLLEKGKLNDTEIQTLFIQILTALQHVHNSGLVHRDIKPSNFMITDSGMIKLADFGIAKDKNRSFHLTETGTQMGTPKYMSPEQIKSAKDVDHRSDIYSLGVVLYEMVAGYFPFETNSLPLIDIQEIILFKPLPLTYTKWDYYISKATSKNEFDRFQS